MVRNSKTKTANRLHASVAGCWLREARVEPSDQSATRAVRTAIGPAMPHLILLQYFLQSWYECAGNLSTLALLARRRSDSVAPRWPRTISDPVSQMLVPNWYGSVPTVFGSPPIESEADLANVDIA